MPALETERDRNEGNGPRARYKGRGPAGQAGTQWGPYDKGIGEDRERTMGQSEAGEREADAK